MFRSKKGIELSINMLVVIILGIVILGVGFSIFNGAFQSVTEIDGKVNEDIEKQLQAMLDDGGPLAIYPDFDRDVERGEFASFSLGVKNIQREPRKFFVFLTYADTSAQYDEVVLGPLDKARNPAFHCGTNSDLEPDMCANDWVRMPVREFTLEGNERQTFQFGFDVPKKVTYRGKFAGLRAGQYIFNLDICMRETENANKEDCFELDGVTGEYYMPDEYRFNARHKIRLSIT